MSGDGRGLQNRSRVRESVLGWVRLPHASASTNLDFRLQLIAMDENEFKRRTKDVALWIIRVVESLPKTWTATVIGKQLMRSGTSIGANYRAACRGKSTADVIHKLSIVEEETDEALYWMEFLVDSGLISQKKLSNLQSDVNEIVAMTVASIKTLRSRDMANPKSKI